MHVAIPLRLQIGRLRLRELGIRAGELAFGFVHAPLRVQLRLVDGEMVLHELLLQHGDLVLREPDARVGLPHRGFGLLLARAHLLVVDRRDHLARVDAIAFAHGDADDATAGLGRDEGVVALDPAAHRQHDRLARRRRREHAPARDTRHTRQHDDACHERKLYAFHHRSTFPVWGSHPPPRAL